MKAFIYFLFVIFTTNAFSQNDIKGDLSDSIILVGSNNALEYKIFSGINKGEFYIFSPSLKYIYKLEVVKNRIIKTEIYIGKNADNIIAINNNKLVVFVGYSPLEVFFYRLDLGILSSNYLRFDSAYFYSSNIKRNLLLIGDTSNKVSEYNILNNKVVSQFELPDSIEITDIIRVDSLIYLIVNDYTNNTTNKCAFNSSDYYGAVYVYNTMNKSITLINFSGNVLST